MARFNSNEKGKRFERTCVKEILKRAGKAFTAKDCYRTPCSGGHRPAGSNDMVISERLKPIFWFGVECKHHKNFKLAHLFRLTEQVKDWHAQVLDACQREGDIRPPLLILRGKDLQTVASMPLAALSEFCVVDHFDCRIHYFYNGEEWVAVAWEAFLDVVGRQAVKTAA
jgi:hypothetical protein